MKQFYQVLINTLIANVTTSFLWFSLVFWVYLETKSVLATGVIGGAYMLLVAICSIWFGTIVDQHKKRSVMIFASAFTLIAFLLAGLLYMLISTKTLLALEQPWFWLFAGVILTGAVVENMRNIALATTVTLLVEPDRRDNANGLVGTVQGIGFIVTSVFSGLSIGLLGMGWTMAIACALTAVSFLHMLSVKIPEQGVAYDPNIDKTRVDIRGSIAAIRVVPGLLGLLFFSMFNNFIGGSYMALMDPYGLTIFSVEMWGVVFGVAGTGFVAGGLLIAKFGLGKKPIKTLLLTVVVMGLIGALFTIRESAILYVVGIWVYMTLIPIVESAEQTVIQRVVPYSRQGRVFGFAQALESAAAPITAFLVAPIAEFLVIPYMRSDQGVANFSWLIGSGEARGIAMIFLVSGLMMAFVAALAFGSKTYRQISKSYAKL